MKAVANLKIAEEPPLSPNITMRRKKTSRVVEKQEEPETTVQRQQPKRRSSRLSTIYEEEEYEEEEIEEEQHIKKLENEAMYWKLRYKEEKELTAKLTRTNEELMRILNRSVQKLQLIQMHKA